MKSYPMRNPVQEYVWGSPTAIPALINQPNPTGVPKAELWMGAHPKAPSEILTPEGPRSLLEVIDEDPPGILGDATAGRFANRLPFLFKVLAAASPLSIQSHPDKRQAENGFARENSLDIPLDAPNRNYKDDNHKPEIVCALTTFHAMRGFRPVEEIRGNLEPLGIPAARYLGRGATRAELKDFFHHLMNMDPKETELTLRKTADRIPEGPEAKWVRKFMKDFPGDIAALSPLYLNLITLKPGEAMFLPAGELHAYLEGTCLELMANSDNVLRGGLTIKHVDVPELLKTLTFQTGRPEILTVPHEYNSFHEYPVPVDDFLLSMARVDGTMDAAFPGYLEMLLTIDGDVSFEQSGNTIAMPRGTSVLVPSGSGPYVLSGRGTVYRATVNRS